MEEEYQVSSLRVYNAPNGLSQMIDVTVTLEMEGKPVSITKRISLAQHSDCVEGLRDLADDINFSVKFARSTSQMRSR